MDGPRRFEATTGRRWAAVAAKMKEAATEATLLQRGRDRGEVAGELAANAFNGGDDRNCYTSGD